LKKFLPNNRMDIFKYSIYASFGVQVITAVADVYALTLKVPEEDTLLRDVLWMELFVQIIEGSFYIWLIYAFTHQMRDVTAKRYYDWFLTTPTMLISLSAYLYYMKGNGRSSLRDFLVKHKDVLIPIVILNATMLAFGYMSEIGILSTNVAVSLGFIPFVAYYYIIYQRFVRDNEKGEQIYWYFFIIWSIYGLAAYLTYVSKNVLYNILDLFAKNFFGLFLAYILYQHRLEE